jgi:hypothetical protein
VETATGKLKSYKSPGSDQIPAELIKAGGGGEILRSEIHKIIRSIWNKEELPQQWEDSVSVLIHKECDKTDIIIEDSPSYQQPTKFYPTFFWPG